MSNGYVRWDKSELYLHWTLTVQEAIEIYEREARKGNYNLNKFVKLPEKWEDLPIIEQDMYIDNLTGHINEQMFSKLDTIAATEWAMSQLTQNIRKGD